jgi:serine/threonine-protein kinase/endoribonuclease IRE1
LALLVPITFLRAASGSTGWMAPETLREGRKTRAVDIFSLGCVLFFCMTGGKHPFGERYSRDGNILSGRPDLFLIAHMPEAYDLVSSMLSMQPERR